MLVRDTYKETETEREKHNDGRRYIAYKERQVKREENTMMARHRKEERDADRQMETLTIASGRVDIVAFSWSSVDRFSGK